MRLAFKNALFLLGGYAAILLLLAAFAVYQLLLLEAKVQNETAQLLAREVAGVLTEPSLDRLLRADREARQNLKTLVEQITRHSQVVSAVSVVDKNGRVVASDYLKVGSRLPTPDEFFGASERMRFFIFGAFPFSTGAYELAVPLAQRGERVGYLRIRLQSQAVADMNRQIWNRLFLAALVGLFFITGLGFALHIQLARRGQTLARTIEAAIRGEAPRVEPELDEFAQAIEAAERAGLEIHRARIRSAEERGRFATLGQILNVGVLLANPEGQLEFASRRARELFGCASDEDLAQVYAKIKPEVEKELKGLPHPGREGVRIDVVPGDPDAGRRLRLEAYPLEQSSGESRLVLVRDRATMKALETDLRLASQLRGLARLYLSVAHDIRAPLAAIGAHLELLGGTFEGDAPTQEGVKERRQGYLAVLDHELQRLQRSLDSMLNHAALPRDDLEELDVRELVLDIEHLLRPQCDRQKVALSACVPEAPLRVLGTRDALKQALINIGINALEAMPQGGKLELRLQGLDSKAVISVADNGPGIPPELMEKIFTMHFTTKGSGTGIGLYVARAVVESNGGEIRVSSQPGHGATFQIDLPAVSQEG